MSSCSVCGLPSEDHTNEMLNNCNIFDIRSEFSANAVPRISEAETAPASAHPSPGTPPGAGASISVASVLLGWCNDIKRELEEFANDGPVGPMVPYRYEPDARLDDLVGLARGLKGLIETLGTLHRDVQFGLTHQAIDAMKTERARR